MQKNLQTAILVLGLASIDGTQAMMRKGSEIEHLQLEVKAANFQIGELKRENEYLQNTVCMMQDSSKAFYAELARKDSQIEDLRGQLNDETELYDRTQGELADTQKTLEDTVLQLADLQEANRILEQEKESLEEKTKDLEEEKSALEEMCRDLQRTADSEKSAKGYAKSELDKQKDLVAARSIIIEIMNSCAQYRGTKYSFQSGALYKVSSQGSRTLAEDDAYNMVLTEARNYILAARDCDKQTLSAHNTLMSRMGKTRKFRREGTLIYQMGHGIPEVTSTRVFQDMNEQMSPMFFAAYNSMLRKIERIRVSEEEIANAEISDKDIANAILDERWLTQKGIVSTIDYAKRLAEIFATGAILFNGEVGSYFFLDEFACYVSATEVGLSLDQPAPLNATNIVQLVRDHIAADQQVSKGQTTK